MSVMTQKYMVLERISYREFHAVLDGKVCEEWLPIERHIKAEWLAAQAYVRGWNDGHRHTD